MEETQLGAYTPMMKEDYESNAAVVKQVLKEAFGELPAQQEHYRQDYDLAGPFRQARKAFSELLAGERKGGFKKK